MILPLPVTGPSSRCRLQLTTQMRLSSSSRAAMRIAPSDSGSPISPSPRNAQTFCCAGVLDAAVVQVAVEPRLVDRVEGGQAHRDGGELPEVRHQPGVRVRRQAGARAVLDLLAEPVRAAPRSGGPRGTRGRRCRGGVALDVDLVAAAGVVLALEEVVEADLVEGWRRTGTSRCGRRPPRPLRFALDTITAAFQRMSARMRRSSSSSPGNHGSRSGGIVLM